MSTITKGRVAQFIKSPLDNGLTRSEQMELARIALAAMDAEPYGFTDGDGHGMLYEPRHKDRLNRPRPLYTAPPGPVVPDDISNAIETLKKTLVSCHRYNYCSDAVKRLEDACRAAMLQEAK